MIKHRSYYFLLPMIVFALGALPIFTGDVRGAPGDTKRIRPINMILVVDLSGSMRELYLPLRKGILNAIRGNIQVNDSVLVVAGTDHPSVIAFKRIASRGDLSELLAKVATLQYQNSYTDFGTWLEFTLEEAREKLTVSGSSNRKTMLYLVTDGKNEPLKTSNYYRSDGELPDELRRVADGIKTLRWSMTIIGIGRDTDAGKLANFLGTADYTISKQNPGRDFDRLVFETLRNNIRVLKFNEPLLLRRGAKNSFILSLIGGWDFGEVELLEATLKTPPEGGKSYNLKISGGAVKLGPKEHGQIKLSFELPSADLPDTRPGQDPPIDGVLSLRFRQGAEAELASPFMAFYIEHWFRRYRMPAAISAGILFLLLVTYRQMNRRALYVKVLIAGQEPTPPVRLREGQTVTMGGAANPPAFRIENPEEDGNGIIKFRKSWRKLKVLGAAGDINLKRLGLKKGDNILGKKDLRILGVQVKISRTSKSKGKKRGRRPPPRD